MNDSIKGQVGGHDAATPYRYHISTLWGKLHLF